MQKKIYSLSNIVNHPGLVIEDSFTIRGWNRKSGTSRIGECGECHNIIFIGEPYFQPDGMMPICLSCCDIKPTGKFRNGKDILNLN